MITVKFTDEEYWQLLYQLGMSPTLKRISKQDMRSNSAHWKTAYQKLDVAAGGLPPPPKTKNDLIWEAIRTTSGKS